MLFPVVFSFKIKCNSRIDETSVFTVDMPGVGYGTTASFSLNGLKFRAEYMSKPKSQTDSVLRLIFTTDQSTKIVDAKKFEGVDIGSYHCEKSHDAAQHTARRVSFWDELPSEEYSNEDGENLADNDYSGKLVSTTADLANEAPFN